MNYQEALNLLGLRTGYTSEQLKKAWRFAAKATHPDIHNDIDANAKMARVNAAYDILKQYLDDPVRARQAEEAEERRRAAEKAAEKAAEERRRREEEAKERARKAAEERKRQEEEQKRAAHKLECEKVYMAFYNCKFFRDANITRTDFYEDRNGLFTLYNSFYVIATDILNNKEKYIHRYEQRHSGKSVNIYDIANGRVGSKIKNNAARRGQRKDYAARMNEEFADLTSALETTYRSFNEFIDYAYVLDELGFDDLKQYILLDDVSREKKKDTAERILVGEDLQYIRGFLNSLEQEEFKDIHNRRFRDNILVLNDVKNFTNQNITHRSFLSARFDGPDYEAAKELLKEFSKNHPNIDTDNIHVFRAYLYSLLHKAKVIYRFIPLDQYNIDNDFKKLAKMAPYETVVTRLYLLVSSTRGFNEIYEHFKNVAQTPVYSSLGLTDGLQKFIERNNALSDVNSYFQPYTLEQLATVPDNVFDHIVTSAFNNKARFTAWLKADPKYKDYMAIYRKYPELFKLVDFDKAFDTIKAKCAFIEQLGLDGKLIDLYKLPEQELMQKAAQKRIKSKIKFIMTHNKKYTPHAVPGFNIFGQDDNSFEIEANLAALAEEDLDYIYAETFINYANNKHPEFMQEPMTMEFYNKLIDEDRDAILSDIYRAERLHYLADKLFDLRKDTDRPIYTYEDLCKMTDGQIMNLEIEMWSDMRRKNNPNQGTGGRK